MNQKNTHDLSAKMRDALAVTERFTPIAIKRMSRQYLRNCNDKGSKMFYFTILELDGNASMFTQDFS